MHVHTTYGLMIQACAKTRQLNKGKMIHARIILSGKKPSVFVSNHLTNMYSKCREMSYALQVFEEMTQRNIVSWTSLISGFSQSGDFVEALALLAHMRVSGERPTEFAFSSALQACASLGWVQHGKQLHSLILKSGFGTELFVASNLTDMYAKCRLWIDSRCMFNEMPVRDVVSWTAMIDACVKSGDYPEALEAFKNMNSCGVIVDKYVVCSVLGACAGLNSLYAGKTVHGLVVKYGFGSDEVVGNSLVDMYSKLCDMDSSSFVLFLDPQMINVISCSSLIDGYAETEELEKAVCVYLALRRSGISPNEYTFSSLLKACANQAVLEQGKQFHCQVIKEKFAADPVVSTVLIDMYGKSGLLDSSLLVFNGFNNPTDIAYNAIIGVFAQHGNGKDAIQHFDRMVSQGIEPNDVSFINLLTACSHAGLVEEGLNYFNSMPTRFNLLPRDEHYACVIDLLSRSGKLKEAEEFINRMPVEPNAFAWCSLLGACKIHGDMKRGKLAAEKLMKLEPDNNRTGILLSNLYAAVEQWEDVKSVWKIMREINVKKIPGYSWMDIHNKTHSFCSGDFAHPQKEEIYEKLQSLALQMKEVGYVPHTQFISNKLKNVKRETWIAQ